MRVGLFEIDSGGKLSTLHRDQRRRQSSRAAGSLRVPDLRLQARHRDRARCITQG